MSRRYAIYLTPPPDSALWRFGSRVLHRDAASGEEIEGFAPTGYTAASWREQTEEPRRYGFHATLKAPFRLREGRDEAEFYEAVAQLAGSLSPFEAGALRVSALRISQGAFVALTLAQPPAQLSELEGRALRELDAFRAPLSQAELARRRPEGLSERQRAQLASWGYPFVLQDFRLHFTLSGRLDQPEPVIAALAEAFAREVPSPALRVDALALFVQDDGGPFRIARRFAFGAEA